MSPSAPGWHSQKAGLGTVNHVFPNVGGLEILELFPADGRNEVRFRGPQCDNEGGKQGCAVRHERRPVLTFIKMPPTQPDHESKQRCRSVRLCEEACQPEQASRSKHPCARLLS